MGVDLGLPNFDAELEELALLAKSAGMQAVGNVVCKRRAPDAALFVGSGKADEIKALALQLGATEILFDQALLAEGGALSDPASFVKRINDMLLGA